MVGRHPALRPQHGPNAQCRHVASHKVLFLGGEGRRKGFLEPDTNFGGSYLHYHAYCKIIAAEHGVC